MRNNEAKNEKGKIIEERTGPLIITGDFNGRVYFKEEQKLDCNGETILQ